MLHFFWDTLYIHVQCIKYLEYIYMLPPTLKPCSGIDYNAVNVIKNNFSQRGAVSEQFCAAENSAHHFIIQEL